MGRSNKSKSKEELTGFDIKIDSFGETKSSLEIDDINQFLNKNVDDKKLIDRVDRDKATQKKDKKASR